jgi:hypothetical protein
VERAKADVAGAAVKAKTARDDERGEAEATAEAAAEAASAALNSAPENR